MVYDGAQLFYQQGRRIFNCSQRYMFSSQSEKILMNQTGSRGGMTPGMFIQQCGPDADYDVYVSSKQYPPGFDNLTIPCGFDYRGNCSTTTVQKSLWVDR